MSGQDYDDHPIGASLEALEAHALAHPCVDSRVGEVPCPCGSAVALLCTACGDPLFIAVNPQRPVCVHARMLLGPARVRPLRRHGRRRRGRGRR